MISINGMKAKSSKDVKPGDKIEIVRRDRRTHVLVNAVPSTKQIAKSEATSFYEVLDESKTEDNFDLI